MNKKGFTLIEVIVSVLLVSIVLISLMATLLKLRSTYSDVNKNTEALIYGSSLSRVINNDLMDNNGVRYASCDINGLRCDFILGNDDQRRLEIVEENIDHGNESASSIGAKEVNHKTIKTTLKYTDTTKEKTGVSNDIIYIRTLTMEDYTDSKGVHTTNGYNFYSLTSDSREMENSSNKEFIDIVTKITISLYDGKDINDSTYNILLYSAGKYDFSNYTGRRYKIEFDLNGADTAGGVFGMDEVFGVGFYKEDSKITSANRLREIPIPKKNTEAFLGYYYGSTSSELETQVIDSLGNIVVSNRFFKESVLLPKELGETPTSWVRAKWGQCESPGYRLEEGVCKPNKFTMTLNPNGGTITRTTYPNVVYQSYVPVLTSKPQRGGYEFLGFYASYTEADRGYYDNKAEPIYVYDIKGDGTLTAKWKICSKNTYSTPEMLDCKNCPNGYFSNEGSEKVESCYMNVTGGHYLVSQAPIQTECSPGTYRDGTVTIYYRGSVSCNKCAPNTYQNASGATKCIPCETGYESGEGATACSPKKLKINLNQAGATKEGTKVIYQKYNTGWYSDAAGTNLISKITPPEFDGYTFNGYYTLSTGGTKIIEANGTIVDGKTKTFVKDGDLYTHKTAHQYTIKYDGNGATGGSTASSTHTYDVAKNLTENGYTLAGYTFAGWSRTKTGAKEFNNKASVKNLTDTNGATVILYAKWTKCTKGTFNAGTTGGCSACPDGYTSDDGATARDKCYVDVTAGKKLVANQKPEDCDKGTYRDGTVRKNYGQSLNCTGCPDGYTSSAGSTVIENCHTTVKSGQKLDQYSKPASCPAGTYRKGEVTKKYGESIGCTLCDTGYSSNAGSTDVSDCKISVLPGKQLVAKKTPTDCPANTYRDGTVIVSFGQSVTCTACPNGQTSSGGATACTTPTPEACNRWVLTNSKYPIESQKWEFYRNCTKVTSGWVLTGISSIDPDKNSDKSKAWYYIENGYMKTGWFQYNGSWYYLKPYDEDGNESLDGGMSRGLIIDETVYPGVYYFRHTDLNDANTGKMLKNESVTYNGTSYHMGSDGKCTNCGSLSTWRQINGHWYYFVGTSRTKSQTKSIKYGSWTYSYTFDSNGKCTNCANQWIVHNCKWRYLNASEQPIGNTKQTINGTTYTFDEDGFCTAPSSCNPIC